MGLRVLIESFIVIIVGFFVKEVEVVEVSVNLGYGVEEGMRKGSWVRIGLYRFNI